LKIYALKQDWPFGWSKAAILAIQLRFHGQYQRIKRTLYCKHMCKALNTQQSSNGCHMRPLLFQRVPAPTPARGESEGRSSYDQKDEKKEHSHCTRDARESDVGREKSSKSPKQWCPDCCGYGWCMETNSQIKWGRD
jgi:hypothetical protein